VTTTMASQITQRNNHDHPTGIVASATRKVVAVSEQVFGYRDGDHLALLAAGGGLEEEVEGPSPT
jgi:hypothetical protein